MPVIVLIYRLLLFWFICLSYPLYNKKNLSHSTNKKKARHLQCLASYEGNTVNTSNDQDYTTKRYEPKYSQHPDDAGTRYQLSGDLFIVRSTARLDSDFPVRRKTRKEISTFSLSSSARMSKYLRECESVYTHFITLTYPKLFPDNGIECKRHLKIFLQRLRERCNKNEPLKRYSAFWFMEFQSRGAVHFHVFVTTFVSYKWLASEWARICGYSGKIRDDHEKSGTSIEKIRAGRAGTAKDTRTYAVKQSQKQIPDGFLNAVSVDEKSVSCWSVDELILPTHAQCKSLGRFIVDELSEL